SDQPDTVDLTALQWLNRKEPRASEKNRHHHRSVKKSETSKRFVTTKNPFPTFRFAHLFFDSAQWRCRASVLDPLHQVHATGRGHDNP
ncbi:MAG: hypothetical protein AAGA21_25325, partial [Pseudomonadota bacterium]